MAKKAAQQAETAAEHAFGEDAAMSEEESAALAAEEAGEETSPPAESTESDKAETPPAKTQQDSKFVPRERLNELIAERDELKQYRERFVRLEERANMAREAGAQAQAAEEAARRAKERPDAEIDPSGARAWDAEQRAIKAEQVAGQLQQQFNTIQQQTQAGFQQNDLNNWISNQIGLARSRVPDYDVRVDFVRNARTAFWGQFFPEQAARNIVAQEELVLLNRARELNMPLETVVGTLSEQWKYAPVTGAPNGVANGNGAVRRQPSAQTTQKLDQIQRGQAAQGLGRIQSGDNGGRLQWQAMGLAEFYEFAANMSEEDYMDHLTDKATGKLFAKKVLDAEMEM
jgi:hypothetical protein